MCASLLQRYLIAIGSNQRHSRIGSPYHVVSHAAIALGEIGTVEKTSPIIASAPIGPSLRQYANAAVLLQTDLGPLALLDRLKRIERNFGRRTQGKRWRSRVLDLDIVLWSGGKYDRPTLSIPHKSYLGREFVLAPLCTITPDWRDPNSGLTMMQCYMRLTRPRAIPR